MPSAHSSRRSSPNPSVKIFPGHRLCSPRQKRPFSKPRKSQIFKETYKIVNVKCQVPSPTSLLNSKKNKDASKTSTLVRREKSVKNEYEERTRWFRQRQQMVKERYSPKMTEIYINKNVATKATGRRSIPSETKKVKESKEVKEVKEVKEKNGKSVSTSTPSTHPKKQRNKNTVSADEILSEAHKMIWFWLFSGLFPTDLQNKTTIERNTSTQK